MPLTPISGAATPSSSAGLFLSFPNSKPAECCHTLCIDNGADNVVPNAVCLDGVVLKLREAHAEHIRRVVRSGDDGVVRRGYGKVEMWRTADIAGVARVGDSMVVIRLLRGDGGDMN